MLRVLRAFAWLRWRVLINSFERGGGRDALERFSGAVEQLVPTLVLLVLVPSALALAAAGAYAGRQLLQPDGSVAAFEVVRTLLLAASVLTAVGPLMLPTGDRTDPVRLHLLPIPRAILYLGQVASALSDPWMPLAIAALLGIAAGLAAGGALLAAAMAAGAGLLLFSVLLGISVLVTGLIHLAVRNRRRGELLTLALVLTLPLIWVLGAAVGSVDRREAARAGRAGVPREEATGGPGLTGAAALLPSAAYGSAVQGAARADRARWGAGMMTLLATAGLLHAAGYAIFVRLLDAPTATAARRPGRYGRASWRLPGVSRGASAVALNHVRLALRTPRGRSAILSPVMIFAVFAAVSVLNVRPYDLDFRWTRSGAVLAAMAGAVSLLALLPLAMNQFALDGPGLTLSLIAPLDTRALLQGKAIGNGMIAAMPTVFCFAAAALLFPTGSLWLWTCVPLGLVSTYLLAAPAAAALSASFPRPVDLNSIGSGSNAHGLAGLLGTLALMVAAAPPVAIATVAFAVVDRPVLAPIGAALWTLASAALCVFLFRPAAVVFERRRENLALLRKKS